MTSEIHHENTLPDIHSSWEWTHLGIAQFIAKYLDTVGKPTELGSLANIIREGDMKTYIQSLKNLDLIISFENELKKSVHSRKSAAIQQDDSYKRVLVVLENAKDSISRTKGVHSKRISVANTVTSMLS